MSQINIDSHLQAITKILAKYDRPATSLTWFTGWIITMVDGAQRLESTARAYVETCTAYSRMLDETAKAVTNIADKISARDLEDVRKHYSEIQILLYDHYKETVKSVARRT